MWSDAYKLTGDTYDPSAGRALMEELAGEAYAPVAQAPVQQLPWYNNLGNNVGGFMNTLGGYASKLAPALASAGQVALKGSGANKTWGNAFGDLAQGLVSGKLGGNLTTSGVSKMAPSTPGAQARPVATPGDLNANGIPDVQEKVTFERKTTGGQAQQPSMSNIKQMDTTFSPGGYSKLPGLLSQGPKSFNEGSGVSTGSPESIVNAPVGEATPEERSNMLMYLGGMLGPEAALKMATDTATQRINEQKATAENLTAQASLQKASTENAKFLWEQSPAYIQRQGQIEYAKKMGDKQAELYLKNQIIDGASVVPVREPNLKRYGNTYGDVMRTLGTTDLSTIVNADRSANARIEAARIGASGAITSAGIQTAGLERAAVQNAMAGAIAMRKMMGNIELPLPDDHPDKPSQERDFILGNKVKASPMQMKQAESLDTEIAIYRNRLATLGVGTTPQKTTFTRPSPKVGSEVTVELNGKKVKAKVVGSGVVEFNGKKYNIK